MSKRPRRPHSQTTPTASTPTARRFRVLIPVAFALAAAIAFGPALTAPFDFDDLPAIVHNTTIRSLAPSRTLFETPPLGTAVSGRPVVNISFALNYAINQFFGIAQDPAHPSPAEAIGFRIVNVLLHVVTALLILVTIRLTLLVGRVGLRTSAHESSRAAPSVDAILHVDTFATIVAALWLLHPLQTEAIDYVSQRTEIVVSLCYVTTLYAAMRHWRAVTTNDPAARRWFAFTVLTSAIGMASKEVMVTAPLVVALHDRAFLSNSWRELWSNRARRALYLSVAATMLITLALDLTGGRAETAGFGLRITPLQYLLSQGWAIPHYLRLALWPNALVYDYGQTPIGGVSAAIGLAALTLIGLAVVIGYRSERWRPATFLGAFFFLVLAPSSSLMPIQTEIAAERRMYLALVVVIVGVLLVVERLLDRFGFVLPAWPSPTEARLIARHKPIAARRNAIIVAFVGAATLVALVATSARRSAMYVSPELLYADALAKFPNARGYDNVGTAILRQNPDNLRPADSMFTRAIALDSSLLQPWLHRAAIATKERRFADGERFALHVLATAPSDSDAISKLGKMYLADEKPLLAIPLLRRLAEQSTDSMAIGDLGNAYIVTGQLDSAVALLERAVQREPTHADVYRWLGAALAEMGRGREAIAPLERGLALDPTSTFARGLLTIAYAQAGDTAHADRSTLELVERANGDVDLLAFTGRGLAAAHRPELAARCFAQAVRANPNDAEMLTQYGLVEATRGDYDAARQLFESALAKDPANHDAGRALAHLERVTQDRSKYRD